jgi:hypothetical protein
MEKILHFFKTATATRFILISCGIGLLSKLVEIKFQSVSLAMQLIAFVLLIYGLIKLANTKIK